MRPRRSTFAADYISDAVEQYAACTEVFKSGAPFDYEELKWSHDVLSQYFAVVSGPHIIERTRKRFASIPPPSQPTSGYVPYLRNIDTPSPVDIVQLEALAYRRRSVRWFLPAPVEKEKIDRALRVAGLSPSACNRQPYFFRIYDKRELIQEILRLPGGVGGYASNVPNLAVIVGQLRNFAHERDRHLIYIDSSLAAMSFLFALEAQEIASCCINWPDIAERERQMSSILGLSPDERPIMLIALGYPDPAGMVPHSVKKVLDSIRSYNQMRT